MLLYRKTNGFRFPPQNNNAWESVFQSCQSQKHLGKRNFPKSKKRLQKYIGLRNLHTTILRNTQTFFTFLKDTNEFYISNDLTTNFEQLNKLILQSCQMALKQAIKDKANPAYFTAAEDAIMIEDDLNKHYNLNGKHTHQ